MIFHFWCFRRHCPVGHRPICCGAIVIAQSFPLLYLFSLVDANAVDYENDPTVTCLANADSAHSSDDASSSKNSGDIKSMGVIAFADLTMAVRCLERSP